MKTAVVGSINMDMTVTAERIPLKGETLKGEDIRYIPGGKGANQAVAMAKLGADVEMFGGKKPHKEHGRHGSGNHPHQSGSRSEHRIGGHHCGGS